jgi:uncharacterized sulfatase
VDQRVGAILDQLRAEGVLDNTIVHFFADHGRPMPWGKQWLSVEGLQVPLIVRGPQIPGNQVEERLVSLIDLAPSALKIAGLPVPAWMQGQAILSGDFPAREQLFAARDRCGDAMDRIRAVITPDRWFVRHFHPEQSRLNWSSYKEDQYPGMPLLRELQREGQLAAFPAQWLAPTRPETELFDLKADPQGLHAISDPKSSADFTSRLDTWIAETKDQGAKGDPSTEPPPAEIQKAKRADYQRNWKKRLGNPEPTDAEKVAWWMKSYHLDPLP